MQTFDVYNRQRALHELGLGPLWLLRNTEPVESATVMETSEAPEIQESPIAPVLEQTPQPAIVSAAAEVAVAWSEPEVIVPKDQPDARPAVPAFESIPEVDDWIAQAIPTALPVEEVPSVSRESSVSMLSWEALQAMVETCRQCGLCQGRKKAVFGTGDKQAKWLFVGEGPGYSENLQGLPFVGAAGQLLDNMLKALGVPRGEQSYIANIVKCRPTDTQGKDRPPTADEVAACLPYLHRQIDLIQPQIIVALGKTAAVSLLGMDMETPVGQLRGRVHQFKGIPVVATYHPAYLLRKPADKAKAWADLCLAINAIPAN